MTDAGGIQSFCLQFWDLVSSLGGGGKSATLVIAQMPLSSLKCRAHDTPLWAGRKLGGLTVGGSTACQSLVYINSSVPTGATYTPGETALISFDASGWDSAAMEQLSDKLSEEDIRKYPEDEDGKKTFDPRHLVRESRWEGLRCIEAMRIWSWSMNVSGSRQLRERWEKEPLEALDKATEAERECRFGENETRPSPNVAHRIWAHMLLLSIFEIAREEYLRMRTAQTTTEINPDIRPLCTDVGYVYTGLAD